MINRLDLYTVETSIRRRRSKVRRLPAETESEQSEQSETERLDSPNNVSEEAELKQSVQNPNLLVLGHDVFGGFIVEEFDGAAPEGDAGHAGLRESERQREGGREGGRERGRKRCATNQGHTFANALVLVVV